LLPDVIERLLAEDLIDYLAIDLKTAPRRYAELHGLPVEISRLHRMIKIAKQSSIEVEFRTTCVPQLVAEQEIREIGELLRGAPLWVLQQFVPQHALRPEWREGAAYPPGEMAAFAQVAEFYVEQVQLRGL
jgi:pyruvate formate lyase activating enzyme